MKYLYGLAGESKKIGTLGKGELFSRGFIPKNQFTLDIWMILNTDLDFVEIIKIAGDSISAVQKLPITQDVYPLVKAGLID